MKPTAPATRGVGLGVLLLLMATAVSSAQNTIEDTAQEAMADFITAWIHSGDAEKAQSYFSESIQSALLAPDRVWAEDTRDRSTLPARYWDFINNVWEPEAYWRTGRDGPAIMTAVGSPLVEAFRDELGVNVISSAQDTFLAFEASNDMSIHSFDAANKNAASTFRNSGRLTLGMLAEIPTKVHAGPFVSFWQAEDDGQWRIQMVGAIRP